MTRKPTTPKNKPAEEQSQEQPDAKPDNGLRMTKAEAIRQALAAGFLGPQQGTAWIRDKFGIEMTPQHFSAAKTQHNKRAGLPPGKRGRKPKSLTVEGYLAPPARKSAHSEADVIGALEALKPLVAAMGVERVKRLADLLA
jgi:hypothetical protein